MTHTHLEEEEEEEMGMGPATAMAYRKRISKLSANVPMKMVVQARFVLESSSHLRRRNIRRRSCEGNTGRCHVFFGCSPG